MRVRIGERTRVTHCECGSTTHHCTCSVSKALATFGHTIIFDGGKQAIIKNGKVVATVEQIGSIQLDYTEGLGDSGVRLWLLHRDGKKMKLGDLCTQDQIWDITDGRQVIDEIRAFGGVTGNILQDMVPPDDRQER